MHEGYAPLVAVVEEAKQRRLVPSSTVVRPKKDIWYHAVINWLLNIFYPRHMKNAYRDRYWTTIGYTIAPTDKVSADATDTTVHELFHVRDAWQKTRVVFGFLYLWPISQGVLLLFTCWLPLLWTSGWVFWLWFGVWLLVAGVHFIPVLPDPWRKRYELTAYTASMCLYYKRHGNLPDVYIEHITKQFTSMAYYVMEPNGKAMLKRIQKEAERIRAYNHPMLYDPLVTLGINHQDGTHTR